MGRKQNPKYDEFRDIDGACNYHLKDYMLRGKHKFTNIELEERIKDAIAHGTPSKYLQCPICGKLTPIKVATWSSAEYQREPYIFMKYVRSLKDNHLERRFTGVSKGALYPIVVRYQLGQKGWYINEGECIPPSLLKSTNPDLFNDLKRILQNTLNQFR